MFFEAVRMDHGSSSCQLFRADDVTSDRVEYNPIKHFSEFDRGSDSFAFAQYPNSVALVLRTRPRGRPWLCMSLP
jgi:hypothetical protein